MNELKILTLSQLDKKYYKQITQISIDNFGGPSAINPEIMEEYLKSPSNIFFIIIKDEDVVGFVGGDIYNKDKIDEIIKLPIAHKHPFLDKFGFLYIIATNKKYSGHGVAKYLLKLFENEMRKCNVNCIYTPVVLWKQQPQYNVRLFKNSKYITLSEIPDYYTQESLEDGWICPECGGACHHTVAVMYKENIDKESDLI